MKQKVDVLLATYNGEKYIKQQIDSILKQTYKDIHLIISDDCSTDKTREILKQYEEVIPEFPLRLKVKAGLTGYA